MKKYIVLFMVLITLSACDQSNSDCYMKGCKIPGDTYYLVEDALIFRSMQLCQQRIRQKTEEYNIRITHASEELKDELYTAGGDGPDGKDYLFLCKQRIHQKGVVFYFGTDEQPVLPENAEDQ